MTSSKYKILLFFLLNFCFVFCDLYEGEACDLKDNTPISNGLPGICKSYQNCPKVRQLYRSKGITREQLTICSNARRIVCCPVEASSFQQLPEERISQKKCKEYGEKTVQITRIGGLLGQKPRELRVDKCSHKSVSLIVGGTEAKPFEFPHQALLGYSPRNREVKWLCGGSLVSEKFVMTAAHCLFDRTNGHVKKVKLGMHYIDDEHDNRKVFIYNIKEKFKHPNYNADTFNEDIALLKLDGTVDLNEKLLPICLPSKRHDNFKAIATGFGKTQTQKQSDVLLKVTLESFTHDECRGAYPEDGIVQIVDKTMVCYGHHTERKDICRGDSGGPLQISNSDVNCTYTQIGISSFGPNRCGTRNLPSAYTNVFNYLDWIEGIVWKDDQ